MTDALVTTPPSPAFYAALVLYGVATLFYSSAYVNAPIWMQRAARWGMVLAFVIHGIDIGWRGTMGVHPGTSVREAIGFLSWIMVGGFIGWIRSASLAIVGAIVAPLALMMLMVARLSPSGGPMSELSTLGRIHIALAMGGVAIFTLATTVSVAYLIHERNLKKKRFDGPLFKQGAALETLDKISHRLIIAGFPIFTLALVLGALWVAKRGSGFPRIEHPIAVLTWFLFATLIGLRSAKGVRGRRAAWLTIAGFLTSVLVVAIYFARRVGG